MFCTKFAKNHVIAGFIAKRHRDDILVNGEGPNMKAKRGQYRLSPNEEAQLIKEETERRRRLRLQQVREQSKQNAARIRQAVKKEKNRQLQKLASDLQNQLEKEKEEKVRHLENQYENSLRSIGQGHKEAGEQEDREEERYLMQLEDNKRADARHKVALERHRREKMFKEYEEKYQIIARQAALDEEKKRAAKIAAQPAPPPDPVQNLQPVYRNPVKMTDIDNFTTTHYHIREDYAVDKADPLLQEDARKAAEEEQVKIEEMDKDLVRLHNDRLSRARVRHNNALEKELLAHDYDKILHDLSDLQRADRDRRQKVVAQIPKQVFEPPHRRIEDKEERQKEMEEAFEDMYMANTDFMGDLSLALDPHPPPDTPTATESLDASALSDATPLHEPSLGRVSAVLKDTSNIPKKSSDSPPKKPEKVLKKLMDRIKTQRQEWMSRSVQEVPERDTNSVKHQQSLSKSQIPTLSEYSLSENGSPQAENIEPMKAKYSPPEKQPRRQLDTRTQSEGRNEVPTDTLLHPMEVAAKIRQTSTQQQPKDKPVSAFEKRTVDEFLEQQKQIEEQKRQLEAKLKELEDRQKILNNSTTAMSSVHAPSQIQLPPNHCMPQGVPLMTNGHLPTGLPPQHHVAPPVQHPNMYQPYPASSVSHSGNMYQPFPASSSFQQPSTYQPYSVPPPVAQQTNVLSSMYLSSNGHVGHLGAPISQSYHHLPSQPYSQVGPISAFTQLSAPVSSHYMNGHSQLTRTSSAPFSAVQTDIPRTFLTPSLPIPSTVSMSVPSSSDKQLDQIKKVKEYQQSLMLKHEQSKRVLAETRAEIERRRQELLERFPQLELKSPDSVINSSGGTSMPVMSQAAISKPESRLLTSQSLSPNRAEMSSLLSKLASQPYYASKLTQPDTQLQNGVSTSDLNKPYEGQKVIVQSDVSGAKKKLDDIRKSLPFDADETIHETPSFSSHRGKFAYRPSPGSTAGPETDLNDTIMSSSTERGSPALIGRMSRHHTSDSETDKSLMSQSKERNDFFEKRQHDLKKQLEEIQRQKEEILQRHNVGQLKLQNQQEKLRTKIVDAQDSLGSGQNGHVDEDDSVNLDSSDDQLHLSDINKPPPQAQHRVLADHRPHELSTIQEIDTPSSTRHSGIALSGRPSLSSSDRSSLSRHSLEFSQRNVIPEVDENVGPQQATPTDRRTVGDTGYHSAHIQNALNVASEFTPGVLERLHKQTNDVFYSLKEDNSTDDSHQHSMHSLSTGPVTPESLSTGALEDRTPSESTHMTPASDNFPFKYAHPQVRKTQNDSTDGSFRSGKSWADELSSYSEKFHTLQPERSSAESKAESVFSQLRDREMQSADRRYEVLHVSQPDHFLSKDQTPESKDSDRLSEYSFVERSSTGDPKLSGQVGNLSKNLLLESKSDKSPGDSKSVELSQYANSSEVSPQSQRSTTDRESPLGGGNEKDYLRDPNQASMTSAMSESAKSSISSYMELKPDNGALSSRDFDFIGRNRVQALQPSGSIHQDQSGTSFKSPGQDINSFSVESQNFSGKVDFTSTPNNKMAAPSNRLSQVSQFTVSPEESRVQAGSGVPMSEAHFTKLSPQFDISSFSTDNQLQAFTKVNPPNVLSRVSEEYESMSSDSSKKSGTPNLSKYQEDSSLSQFTVTTDHSSNDVSLTQITVNTDVPAVRKSGVGEMSQYTAKSSPDTHGKTDSSLSQYSMDSPSTQNVSDNKSDMNFSNNQTTGTVNSQNSLLTDTPEEDESYVEKKFANLDLLIKESRDLITKHKQLISKNKEWEALSSTGESVSSTSPPLLPPSRPPNMPAFKFDTSGTSAMTDDMSSTDVSPLRTTEDERSYGASSTNLTDDLRRNKTDPSGSYLDQITQESGITDEPDLTLVTLDSEVSQHEISQQLGNETHRSEGASSTNDSVLSFEQHEMTFEGTHGRDEPSSGKQESKGLKLNVQRDAGDENVFRAVPVLASPTVALSMKFSSSQDMKFTKPPVSWSFDPDEKPKTNKDTKKNMAIPLMSKMKEPPKNSNKFLSEFGPKEKGGSSSGGLNKALQPRKSGEGPTGSESKWKSSNSSPANTSGSTPISLGEFMTSKKEGTTLLGRKIRPATAPKPLAKPANTASGPSALSKTLSSWKKTRGVKSSAVPPPPTQSLDLPYSATKVLPKDVQPSSKSAEEKMYEKNMRAYNPRLFRLQNKIEEGRLIKSNEEEKQKQSAAHREKVKEFQKKLQENMRRKQQMKREKKLQQQKT